LAAASAAAILHSKFRFVELFQTRTMCVISTGAKRIGEIFAPKNCSAKTIVRRSFDSLRLLRMTRLRGAFVNKQSAKLEFDDAGKQKSGRRLSAGIFVKTICPLRD